MVQFKPYFMGQSNPPHTRLTTVQKCFRTSDIDSVGDTSHLTFFEMLGNFSVGDYFKEQAIPWAWEYVTQVLALDPDRLWAAVYLDDDEAFEVWRRVGVPEPRIRRYGEEHNFWFSGDVGPCGPCSEIHYDFGPEFGCGPDCEPDHDECNRFLEIWNLVFMTYFLHPDGSRTPLPSRNIDTGAGFERIASVLLFQSEGWDKIKLPSVYETDLFLPVIRKIEELSGKRYGENARTDKAMRIVAEHARAVTFLIGDERTPVIPSNEERGYAVRRILRRAVYFGRQYLGLDRPFLQDVAATVLQKMSEPYPELERQRKFIMDIIGPEERRFEETLGRGLEILEQMLTEQSERIRRDERAGFGFSGLLTGDQTFLLHDTYGFPLEVTREIAAERGFQVDEAGYHTLMQEQRERARAAVRAGESVAADAFYASLTDSQIAFRGYETLETEAKVLALLSTHAEPVEAQADIEAPAEVEIILDETPFYPEGGGQVGDRGEISSPNGRVVVEDTQRVAERLIVHKGRVVEGRISAGDTVTARVDPQHRADTMRNHTATHLLNAALRRVLGTHVRQSGSLVAPSHLRFDFTHSEALAPEQLAEVQRLVNQKVRENLPVKTRISSFDQAMEEGVLAFFGEKYGQEVRVVEVDTIAPRFSAELCGGTHCQRTGDVGFLLITSESSIGAGTRRIEALTGRGAEEYAAQQFGAMDALARRLGVSRDALASRIESLLAEADAQRKRIERLERSLASAPATDELLRGTQDIDGVRVLAVRIDVPSVDALRYIGDAVRKSLGSGVAVLAAVVEEKPQFIAIVSGDATKRGPHAGQILKRVASVAGGGGGGRPDMAQGGGKEPGKLDAALRIVPDVVREMLGRQRS